METLIFVLVALAIGGGGGIFYERKRWTNATGFYRADQFRDSNR